MTCGRAAALLIALAVTLGCSGPPWYMGSPRDGRPSIPSTSLAAGRSELRRQAEDEARRCCTALELQALNRLDSIAELSTGERRRLACLLARRAHEMAERGRAIAAGEDLRRASVLDPSRALPSPDMAVIERAAGDAWLSLGELERADAAYGRAARHGASDLAARRALAQGGSVHGVGDGELARALSELPSRVVPAVAEEYLARGGSEPRLLERARRAARVERAHALAQRLAARLAELPVFDGDAGLEPAPTILPVPALECGRCAGESEAPDLRLLSGASAASRVLPALRRDPALLQGPEARLRAALLVAEDPTSADAWEAAALVDAAAGRTGAIEEDLRTLVYASPDRGQGLRRAAAIWDGAGQPQRACATWLRAARWNDDPDDPSWATVIACAQRDPSVADAQAIRAYVLGLAPAERRAELESRLSSSSGE